MDRISSFPRNARSGSKGSSFGTGVIAERLMPVGYGEAEDAMTWMLNWSVCIRI